MKNLLAFLSVWLALPLAAQTVNPNQIRPATVDGQVLTTPIANQAPSWQTPASGVSIATTPPCTVNGGTGPVSSGTATITCANGTQTYYKQQGTGTYYQLIRPTACVPVHSSGWGATCAGNNAGGITTNGTGSASLTYSFTGITPPAGATLVGAYVYGISSATGNTNAGEGFGTVGVGTNCTSGNLIPASKGVNFAWPTAQGGCQLSTTSGLDTVQIEMNMIVSAMSVGGSANVDDVGIEVDYNVGPTPPASASLLVAPPLSLNNNVLGMGPIWPTATYPTTIARLSQYAYTWAGTIVPVTDAVNSTDCATGGGSTLVDCISDGDGGWTARSFTGGITALTGDVSATGPGSAAATVLKVNNGTIPTSQTCVGTNSSGQFIDGSCGGGTMTDGAGSTTAGYFALTSSTAHAYTVDTNLDDGHTTANTLTYTGTGGITASAGPLTSANPGGGVGSSFFLTQEGTVPSGLSASGQDNCYADSTQHGILCNFNAGTTLPLVQGPASDTTNDLAAFSGANGGKLIDTSILYTNVVTAASTLTSNALMTGAGSKAAQTVTTGTGVVTALGVNTGTAGAFDVLIASGTSAMGTGAISSGTCATVVTTSATGVATTDTIQYTPNTDPTAVTGYAPSASGSLYIWAYPTSGNVNFRVCNNTSGSLTPSALTLNWRVVR